MSPARRSAGQDPPYALGKFLHYDMLFADGGGVVVDACCIDAELSSRLGAGWDVLFHGQPAGAGSRAACGIGRRTESSVPRGAGRAAVR